MYSGQLDTISETSAPRCASPLMLAINRKKDLEQKLVDVNRFIELLKNNPEIEELLKLSRHVL